jgi:hypothetical protein
MALAGVFGACSAMPGGSPGTVTDPSPTVIVGATTPRPSQACFVMDESVDTAPSTVANLMPFSTTVVVAEVASIDEGIWNTKDGQQPTGHDVKRGPTFNPRIETPINLGVADAWFGDARPGALRVVNPGGAAGCSEHHVSNAAALETGATYVLFLQPSPDADGQRHPELPLVLVAWPVDDTGHVTTAEEGSLSLAQLEDLVRHPVAPATTPEPTPAGSDHPG